MNTSASSDSSGLEQQFRSAIANVTNSGEVDVFAMSISPDQITRIFSHLLNFIINININITFCFLFDNS